MFKTKETAPIYTASLPEKIEMREIEKSFARLFATEDGRKVLAHLQAITFQRALGALSADEELRFAEGQRALMAKILRLIDRGRNP
ncbi:MAG: hypothetical protein OEY94_06840 [Alphaproteobacteria bacterium]|nr:hypothetical protein [Alphaproteobacteria bacterium]